MTLYRSAEAAACVAPLLRVASSSVDATVLSHSPDDRLVVRFSGGGRTVVGKRYPDDTGARTFSVMRDVAAVAGAPLVVPEPLLWSEPLRLLVMSDVAGPSYRQLIQDVARHPERAAAMHRAGAALARLHACPVPARSGPPRTMADHTHELIRPCPPLLAERRPDLASRVLAVHSALLAAEPAHHVAPLHRDVHPGQLVALPGGGVGVLDWDLHAPGDPALDLGNLLAYLDSRLGDAGTAATNAVVQGYQSVAGDDVVARTAPYQALAYLRMAAKRVRLGPGAGGPLDEHEALRRAEARCG